MTALGSLDSVQLQLQSPAVTSTRRLSVRLPSPCTIKSAERAIPRLGCDILLVLSNNSWAVARSMELLLHHCSREHAVEGWYNRKRAGNRTLAVQLVWRCDGIPLQTLTISELLV